MPTTKPPTHAALDQAAQPGGCSICTGMLIPTKDSRGCLAIKVRHTKRCPLRPTGERSMSPRHMSRWGITDPERTS